MWYTDTVAYNLSIQYKMTTSVHSCCCQKLQRHSITVAWDGISTSFFFWGILIHILLKAEAVSYVVFHVFISHLTFVVTYHVTYYFWRQWIIISNVGVLIREVIPSSQWVFTDTDTDRKQFLLCIILTSWMQASFKSKAMQLCETQYYGQTIKLFWILISIYGPPRVSRFHTVFM